MESKSKTEELIIGGKDREESFYFSHDSLYKLLKELAEGNASVNSLGLAYRKLKKTFHGSVSDFGIQTPANFSPPDLGPNCYLSSLHTTDEGIDLVLKTFKIGPPEYVVIFGDSLRKGFIITLCPNGYLSQLNLEGTIGGKSFNVELENLLQEGNKTKPAGHYREHLYEYLWVEINGKITGDEKEEISNGIRRFVVPARFYTRSVLDHGGSEETIISEHFGDDKEHTKVEREKRRT